MNYDVGDLLISSGLSGFAFYYWGVHIGVRKTMRMIKETYADCIDEKSGRVTRVRMKK